MSCFERSHLRYRFEYILLVCSAYLSSQCLNSFSNWDNSYTNSDSILVYHLRFFHLRFTITPKPTNWIVHGKNVCFTHYTCTLIDSYVCSLIENEYEKQEILLASNVYSNLKQQINTQKIITFQFFIFKNVHPCTLSGILIR